MLSPSGKLVLQGLLVLQAAASDTHDCCPVKHVEGLGSLSGTYFLVSNSSGNLVDPECRDSCGYVKDEHPDPEQLFCLKFSLETNVKCQEDSPFAPQIMTDDVSVPFLSLTETEGEELLLISKEFPPPPEGEIADVCDPGGFPFSQHISDTSTNGGCNLILLDENSQANCEQLLDFCFVDPNFPNYYDNRLETGATTTTTTTITATTTTTRSHTNPPPTTTQPQLAGCPPFFDGFVSWPATDVGQTASVLCHTIQTYPTAVVFAEVISPNNLASAHRECTEVGWAPPEADYSLYAECPEATTTTATTTTSTQPQPQTSISASALPSWSLKWCPRRIQGNPNRLRFYPQCCFHPITQRPRGNLWGCLNKYTKRQN